MKISVIESPVQLRVLFEGKLVAPWAAELRTACKKARVGLHGRELVIDLNGLTAVSQEGENTLLELVSEGVTVRSSGVFTKHVLRQLARRVRSNRQEASRKQSTAKEDDRLADE